MTRWLRENVHVSGRRCSKNILGDERLEQQVNRQANHIRHRSLDTADEHGAEVADSIRSGLVPAISLGSFGVSTQERRDS